MGICELKKKVEGVFGNMQFNEMTKIMNSNNSHIQIHVSIDGFGKNNFTTSMCLTGQQWILTPTWHLILASLC
jgi:hypothetical protein